MKKQEIQKDTIVVFKKDVNNLFKGEEAVVIERVDDHVKLDKDVDSGFMYNIDDLNYSIKNFMSGSHQIVEERNKSESRYDYAMDDEYDDKQLRKVASILCLVDTDTKVVDTLPTSKFNSGQNPWGLEFKYNDEIQRLRVAGGLIAAEIDRLQRLKLNQINNNNSLNKNTGVVNPDLNPDYIDYKNISKKEFPLDSQICIVSDETGDWYNLAGWDDKQKLFVNQFGPLPPKYKYWTPLELKRNTK